MSFREVFTIDEIMEISPDISESDELINEAEPPIVPDHVILNGSPASKRQKTEDEAACVEKPEDNTDKTFPPRIEVTQVRSLSGQRWEMGHLNASQADKRIEEAHRCLKQIAASKLQKPRAEKDESQLFCDLLCLKLRALNEETRERAMLEINNLMFYLKRESASNIPAEPSPYHQQPGYYPGYGPRCPSGPYQQVAVYGPHQNSVPHPPPPQTGTATSQRKGNVQRTSTTQTPTSNTSQPGLYRGAPAPMVEMAMMRPPHSSNYFH